MSPVQRPALPAMPPALPAMPLPTSVHPRHSLVPPPLSDDHLAYLRMALSCLRRSTRRQDSIPTPTRRTICRELLTLCLFNTGAPDYPSVKVVIHCRLKRKFDKRSLVYDPAEHEHSLLPPPIHVGKYLREKRVDFQLPYDIWWLYDNDMVSCLTGDFT